MSSLQRHNNQIDIENEIRNQIYFLYKKNQRSLFKAVCQIYLEFQSIITNMANQFAISYFKKNI